jgi:RNA polymerase sigma factor (sigma-70 family)
LFGRQEGREPSPEEVALFLGEDASKIAELMPLRERVLSLDADSPTEGVSLAGTIASGGPAPYEQLNREQVTAAVHSVLDFLTERERAIMELRFGLGGEKAHSLRKTSRKVGLSQEGVRRIERRALDKLNRPSIKARLEGLLTA